MLKKKQDERELLRKKKVNMQKGSNPTVPPLEVDEEVDNNSAPVKKPDQQLKARTQRINREKQQILRRKLQTVRQGTQGGASTSDITAGYEPEGDMVEGKGEKNCGCGQDPCITYGKKKNAHKMPDGTVMPGKTHKEATYDTWVKTFEDKVKGNEHVNVNPKIGPTCPKCAGLVVDEECQNCGKKCASSDVKEAKYEAGASNYGKMSIRNKRAVGYGGNAAPPEERRKAHSERMKKHNKEEVEVVTELSKRTLGNYVKDASSDAAMKSMDHGNKPLAKDAPKREKKILKRLSGIRKATDKLAKEETVMELNRLEKEQGKKSGGGKDKALNFVKNKIRQETGRPAGQQKKVKGAKTNGTQKYLDKQKDKKAYADKAKKAGFKSTQDYTNTMARYGGESNYKAGRGLGT